MPGKRNAITEARVEAAKKRFRARVREFEASGADETDIEEVIARGVTRDMLQRASNRALRHVSTSLRDGTLILMGIRTDVHEDVQGSAGAMTCTNIHGSRSYLSAHNNKVIDFPVATFRLDVCVVQFSRATDPYLSMIERIHPPVPVVLIDVEVGHRTVRTFIEYAGEYLEHPTVQRVVGFFIFGPRQPECDAQDAQDAQEWRFAALAVTFDRDPTSKSIRVVSAKQFGNAPVLASVLRSLSEVPSVDEPAGRDVVLAPSPFAEVRVPVNNSIQALNDQTPATHPTFDVDIPGSDDPMRFDLWRLFRAATIAYDIPLLPLTGILP